MTAALIELVLGILALAAAGLLVIRVLDSYRAGGKGRKPGR